MHHVKSQFGSGCGCQNICGQLWSTEKKIRVLQEKLDQLEIQKQEIETLIRELKDES